jgi:2-polyprenyl-3-methyl-5-hydroxy-6-metoxy-1,4-benzoquinol methylase
MIKVTACPVCKNTNFTNIASCTDYTVSHETFSIIQCTSCKLAATSPRPETKDLGKYYQSEEYISHSGKSSGGIGILYRIARRFSLNKKEALIRKYLTPSSLLDFGCGTGEFLETSKRKGWNTYGIEPSDKARRKALEKINNNIFKSLDDLPEIKVSAITAWHVLEHVDDLNETLQKFKKLLNEKGLVFIAVPNYQAPEAKKYKDYWAGYDVPRHLWHFSKESMQSLLKQNNFTPIEILPMKLDAYYISLLSEKYKSKNKLTLIGLVQAFVSGITSNLTASRNNNYSSLIYIARVS